MPPNGHLALALGLALSAACGSSSEPTSADGAVTLALPDGGTVSATRQSRVVFVGDSISWHPAPFAPVLRRELLRELPTLAFVGTRSDMFGYAHEAAGGDSTVDVLARLDSIGSAPWYHVLVGHNDGARSDDDAAATADRILAVVDALAARPDCERVFVGSLLPHPADPEHDAADVHVNALVSAASATRPRATYVDYATTIRASPGFGSHFAGQHCDEAIQAIMAEQLAKAMSSAPEPASPPYTAGRGVRVTNLWAPATGQTSPLSPGYYLVSATVSVTGPAPTVTFAGGGIVFADDPVVEGQNHFQFFTEAVGYGYEIAPWIITPKDCALADVLWERRRPLGVSSRFEEAASYVDAADPIAAGEHVENP